MGKKKATSKTLTSPSPAAISVSPLAIAPAVTVPLVTVPESTEIVVAEANSTVNVDTVDNGDELVTPPPHLVHPSGGKMTRRELAFLLESHKHLGLSANGGSSVAANSGAQATPRVDVAPAVAVSPEKPSWAEVFQGDLNSKGMSLGFINPVVKDGKKFLALDPVEVNKGSECWANAIILFWDLIPLLLLYNALLLSTGTM